MRSHDSLRLILCGLLLGSCGGDAPLELPPETPRFTVGGSASGIEGELILVNGTASVALSEDSNATGINGDQANNASANSGAVYIFR